MTEKIQGAYCQVCFVTFEIYLSHIYYTVVHTRQASTHSVWYATQDGPHSNFLPVMLLTLPLTEFTPEEMPSWICLSNQLRCSTQGWMSSLYTYEAPWKAGWNSQMSVATLSTQQKGMKWRMNPAKLSVTVKSPNTTQQVSHCLSSEAELLDSSAWKDMNTGQATPMMFVMIAWPMPKTTKRTRKMREPLRTWALGKPVAWEIVSRMPILV
ncbi:hypothetical protein FGO68_gene12565 [Halteria grandinella]|uniref:Uncharacterized protein n=1 Tax=Halteria grandinella TaxID=5974 RepID=A0A8J8NWY1_HALGN|nr:hypothetical protein FGO68_gene12565 [Halteria grandinella]